MVMTPFAPPEIIGIAYDSGGVTTSTITVPLVTALGVGLATSIRGRNPMVDGFGLIAFASLTPIVFVMVYGMLIMSHLLGLLGDAVKDTLVDVLPIAVILVTFQLLVLRRPSRNWPSPRRGGPRARRPDALPHRARRGALPPGRDHGRPADRPGSWWRAGRRPRADWRDYYWVYVFGAAIGFATTIAEPALIAVSIKAKDVSAGTVRRLGPARRGRGRESPSGSSVGVFASSSATPLPWFIIVRLRRRRDPDVLRAPRSIVPLAYDSGGVTTSTVTVPLVAGLGLGLAETVPGRSPLVDGFGLIAFASLFPMITVMAYAQVESSAAQPPQGARRRAVASQEVNHAGSSCSSPSWTTHDTDRHRRRPEGGRHRLHRGEPTREARASRRRRRFFGLSLETQRDMVLLLVEEHLEPPHPGDRRGGRRVRLEPGTGIAFQIDVEDAVGVLHPDEVAPSRWRRSCERERDDGSRA